MTLNKGDTFGVNHGPYIGKFLTYVRVNRGHYEFLLMPNPFFIICIKDSQLESLMKANNDTVDSVLEYIETIPSEVFNVVEHNFFETVKNRDNILIYGQHLKNISNRR